jgi:hypothetical protein
MSAATTPLIQRSSTSPTGSPTGGCAEDATSPTPPDMTDRMLRAVACVRESTEEQGQGFSPDAQREGIRRFAPENSLELIGEYCDFLLRLGQVRGAPRVPAPHGRRRRRQVRRRARVPHQPLRPQPSRGTPLQAVAPRAPRHPRHLRDAADGRRPHRPLRVPRRVDPRDVRRVLLRVAVLLDPQRATREGSSWPPCRKPALGLRPRPAIKLAIPHPERAPLVLALFERYATGQESDRTLEAWLNAKGAHTARERLFSKDTVREMLCNAAYAGYVSELRDKSRSIKGLHEPIVTDELFDRVQEVRSWSSSTASAAARTCTAAAPDGRGCAATDARPAASTATASRRRPRRSRLRSN